MFWEEKICTEFLRGKDSAREFFSFFRFREGVFILCFSGVPTFRGGVFGRGGLGRMSEAAESGRETYFLFLFLV